MEDSLSGLEYETSNPDPYDFFRTDAPRKMLRRDVVERMIDCDGFRFTASGQRVPIPLSIEAKLVWKMIRSDCQP